MVISMEKKRNSFGGSIGFVLAAAGSAVGLGNLWRFPYLAAKDGGGLFLVVYIILVLTFGFTLLTTEIAIGRRTKQSPLTAYKAVNKKSGFLGYLAAIIPMMILPYYCVIGGWVTKYLVVYCTGAGTAAADTSYFTGFLSGITQPIVFLCIFLALCAVIVARGVDKGIERMSKFLMPVLLLLILVISVFSLTIKSEGADGVVRSGFDGLKVYLIPDLNSLTFSKLVITVVDAMGQMFYSLSVAMGIMIAYGSYVPDDANLVKSINQIELFDTVVAFLAGVMIIPSVFVFMGREGMEASGPGLMFVSLPQVFHSMGKAGTFVAILFFAMVLFAALTSAVSIMEAVVSSVIDKFGFSRIKAVIIETVIALGVGIVVCIGYNLMYFEFKLPNGTIAQMLDILDYISNYCLMPIVSIGTCILIGWIMKPDYVIDEVEKSGVKFSRRTLYIIMIRFVAPAMLMVLLLQALGLFSLK